MLTNTYSYKLDPGTGQLCERVPTEHQFKVTLYFLLFRLAGCSGTSRVRKARCQVVLNEEQTDVFALRPALDAAPCKYWQL